MVLAELWKPSSSGCTPENKATPLSPCPGQHPGIPCQHLLPWACSHVPGHASSCSSDPQSHGSCPWPAPSGCATPSGCSLGTGSGLGAALPGVRQVRTHVLRGCSNSSTICPPFLLPARDLGVLGEHPQALQQTLLQAPPDATALVGTGISWVQRSFSRSPAAGKRINSQIRVLRRRKHQQRSS